MLGLPGAYHHYFCHENVSMRYRHNGLGCFVKNELHRDPLNGDVYIFMSKDQKTLRIYYYFNRKLILTDARCLSGVFPRPSFDTDAKLFEVSRADFVRMVEDIIPVKRTFAVSNLNH